MWPGIALAASLAVMASTAVASPIKQTMGDVASLVQEQADLRAEREQLARDAARLEAELAALRDEHRDRLVDVQERLVALYTKGHSSAVASLVVDTLAGEGDLTGMAVVMSHLERHERTQLEDLAEVVERMSEVEDEIARGLERVGELEDEWQDVGTQLREARAELARMRVEAAERAAAARAKAERFAQQQAAALPVQPSITPEAVERATAEQLEEPLGDEGDAGAAESASAGPAGYTEVGVASWYGRGDGFAGQMTASGEIFDPTAMTAAHPHLPFGTMVTVTGPGGSVVVRINDRGPFVGGRIIDLSWAAGRAIGLTSPVEVTLTVNG